MALNSEQLEILNFHAQSGDRIAYYDALASFGVSYGVLALGVVENNTLSGASATSYFLGISSLEGQSVSSDQLAKISLDLMLADNAVRQASGGVANVDQIQAYHDQVFLANSGVSAYAWTPNYYLQSFATLSARQAAWDGMLTSSPLETYSTIAARRIDYIDEHLQGLDNPLLSLLEFFQSAAFVAPLVAHRSKNLLNN